jgi:hypothetical protein
MAFVSISFNVGCILMVIGAYGLWPNALPWSLAFWLGWTAAWASLWLSKKAREATVAGQGALK